MQTKSVAIRVQTLDGVWETTGVDRLRGVYPENDSYMADEWGSSKCSFDLHRDPGAIFPDLLAFTPIEVEIGGQVVWSGRVLETPIREGDRIYNVQGQGWQYHLDDDTFAKQWVHTSLTDFKDTRSVASTDLTVFCARYQAQVDQGAILLCFQNGVLVDANVTGKAVGATIDLGEGRVKRVAVEVAASFPVTSFVFSVCLHDTPYFGNDPGRETPLSLVAPFATPNFHAGTATNGHRYATILLWGNGVNATMSGDHWIRITQFRLFAEAAYDVGTPTFESALKASTVVGDALDQGTLLLSADRSAIQVPTFAIPEFGGTERRTPREFITAANALQDWRTKIDVYRRMIFEPKASNAKVEIGVWPGSMFDDASANSGDEIYSRVIVEGTAADGSPISVERTQGQQSGATFEVVSSPAASNPSFAVDASTWTPSSPTTMTRTTTAGLYDSAPGGGVWGNLSAGLGDTLVETFTGTFQAGVTYRLTLAITYQTPTQGTPTLDVAFGSGSDVTRARWTPGASFGTQTLSWTPTATYSSGVTLKFTTVVGHPATWLIDSLAFSITRPTLVDRRGFRRTHILPVKANLNSALGQQVADVWLAAHKTTPLKGSVQITGDAACRDILTGASIPPERLLTMTGDLLRLSHRVDPDTGGHGRDGRIAEVTYTPATDTAVVAIDSRRTSHEALLERLAVVVGSR